MICSISWQIKDNSCLAEESVRKVVKIGIFKSWVKVRKTKLSLSKKWFEMQVKVQKVCKYVQLVLNKIWKFLWN